MLVKPLDARGALTRSIKVGKKKQPLWRALFDGSADPANEGLHHVTPELFARFSRSLSLIDRIDALIDMARGAYGLWGYDLVPLDTIGRDAALGRWATIHADRLLAWSRTRRGVETIGSQETVPIFLALVRNDIPLEPRWDALVPVHCNTTPQVLVEIWRAVPDARRETVLADRLAASNRVTAYATAALLAPELRSKACTQVLSYHLERRLLNTPPAAKVRAIIKAVDASAAADIKPLARKPAAKPARKRR